MARGVQQVPQSANLTADQIVRGIARLKKRVSDLDAFDPATVSRRFPPEVGAIETSIDETLDRVFGANTIEYNRYSSATRLDNGPLVWGGGEDPIYKVHEYLREGKDRALALLRQAIRGLEEELEDKGHDSQEVTSISTLEPQNSEIFVVHGHDEAMRETVARFLEKIGYRPIVLHEQANRGRTVIEKIEAHSAVGFAVVLLSGDDLGRAVAENELEVRARQNVLLELGYFMGRLGRSKVCALMRGDVKFPSDFAGVVYTPFDDAGGWRSKLATELQEAGYVVDWNKVMGR